MTINNFFNKYLEGLVKGISKIDTKSLDKAANEIIKTIKRKGIIYVCGNGGSAAISNHYICDFLKFLRQNTKLKPKIISLSNNIGIRE